MQANTLISILTWIIVGSVAGYLASLLLRAQRQGCIVNIILGVIGAFVGGFVMNLLLPQGITGVSIIDAIIHATVGAIIILVVLELILPGRQIGVRDEDGQSRRRRRRR